MRGLFYIFILFIICCHPYDLHAQDQKIADSLTGIYIEDKLQGIEKLVLLRDLSFYEKRDLNLSMTFGVIPLTLLLVWNPTQSQEELIFRNPHMN